MPRNIEIKARIDSVDTLAQKVAPLATDGPTEIAQDDTFFRCESGRLKLRTFSAAEGELIFYRRANEQGPKESFYIRTPTSSPDRLRESLSLACGQAGRVVKQRTLYLVGRTRVHLDRVEGLGHFLELEVVLEENEPAEVGIAEAHALMARLGVEPSQLIDTAYVDLLSVGETRRELATVSLLVHDYDEAIRFFTEALRFELVEDAAQGPGKRWVVVSPGRGQGASLVLAKAANDTQRACVGHQSGGRVWLFLHTTDFEADVAHMKAHGVRFLEETRHEAYGTVAVFQDLYGNKWDLLQRATG